jgi:hypothetical protein
MSAQHDRKLCELAKGSVKFGFPQEEEQIKTRRRAGTAGTIATRTSRWAR